MEYSETATSPSTGVASGVVTGIRLLVVMAMKRVLRAVMMSGYRIRYTGSGLSRGIKIRPAHRRHGSVLARALNALCPDGGKSPDSLHRRKIDPPADLVSALKLRVLGDLFFFAEAG
jgi:hypothetical protein